MFHKILAALGNVSSRRCVFEQALKPAMQNKAQLLLVHVLNCEDVVPLAPIPNHNFFVGQSAYESYWQSHEHARRKAVEWLNSLVQEAKEAGIETQYVIHDMSPERVIAMQAKAWGADLIVMGGRGSTNTDEPTLGSISDYILHHAPCTVLVLQTRNKEAILPEQSLQNTAY